MSTPARHQSHAAGSLTFVVSAMEASSDEFVKCLAKGVAVYSDAYGHAPVDTDDQAYLRTFTGRQAERSAQTGVVIADNLRLAQEYDAESMYSMYAVDL